MNIANQPNRPAKPWPWRTIKIANGFVLFWALGVYTLAIISEGAPGSEFLGPLIAAPLLLAVPIIWIADILLIGGYLIRRRPRGKKLAAAIASEALLLGLGLIIGLGTWQGTYVDQNISADRATELIKSCQVGDVIPPETDSPHVLISVVDETGVEKQRLASDEANWPAIKAAVLANKDKCHWLDWQNFVH